MTYIGRFAPSPTGPLHYGSIIAALASYLDARANNGAWLLRIEDLDPPRESAEAPSQIIQQLRAFELNWDADVLYQSTRLTSYAHAMDMLDQHTYACTCSRKSFSGVYPGRCRSRRQPTNQPFAVRLRVPTETVAIDDIHLGHLSWHLENEVGDFIVRRKDTLFAYQLAVVVDDIHQHITRIVRGADLLDSTPRQLALYSLLGASPPEYMHIPVVVDAEGDKLSKQTGAAPVSTTDPMSTLRSALTTLGQSPQSDANNVPDLLARAADNWDTSRIPHGRNIHVPAL